MIFHFFELLNSMIEIAPEFDRKVIVQVPC